MPYHLNDDEIQLLLALFDTLRSQAATPTLTSSLELLNDLCLRLSQALSFDSDSDSLACCLKTYSGDSGPPTDNTFVQPVSLKLYHCKFDSNLP
jgi:hypothetical protein